MLRDALPDGSFAEREAAVLAMANELCREILVDDLAAIAASFPDEILVDGVAYCRHTGGSGAYHSRCGELPVQRDTFRKMGAPTFLDPLFTPLRCECRGARGGRVMVGGASIRNPRPARRGFLALRNREKLGGIALINPLKSQPNLAGCERTGALRRPCSLGQSRSRSTTER